MVIVRPASGNEVETALKFLTQRVPTSQRRRQIADVMAAVERGELSLEGLLLACRAGRPVGAILTSRQAGDSASLWPPEVAEAGDEETTDELIRCAIARLVDDDISVIQAIVEREDEFGRQVLTRNGIAYLTDLVFMERRLSREWSEEPSLMTEFITYSESTRERFEKLLSRTYDATWDCPELDGARTASQALQSHLASGRPVSAYWRVYRLDDRDAGVVLISEHVDQAAWELVYMGVAPEFRGRGLGRAMLLDTLPALPQRLCDTVFLAVDCRNRFARNAYVSLGFVELATRALHLYLPSRARV